MAPDAKLSDLFAHCQEDCHRCVTTTCGSLDFRLKKPFSYSKRPGMGHCSGGSATLDSFDLLSALIDCVEKGAAPDSTKSYRTRFSRPQPRPMPLPCSYAVQRPGRRGRHSQLRMQMTSQIREASIEVWSPWINADRKGLKPHPR